VIDAHALRYAWPGSGHDTIAIESLQVAAGEAVFLHGPSGSGKSTLLALMAGVLVATGGSIALAGTDWASLSPSRRDAHRALHVGYVFQQFNLLPYLSVVDNVRLAGRFALPREQRAGPRGAEALLEHMGLAPALWPKPAAALSVGQQQRVAAARALYGRPEVVIADEPTSALDAPLRDAFMALLLAECRAAGSTLVFVSHDERLSAAFDRRIALAEINRA
jgi:putative ABC transport system ATP-binding protein